jgi:hypothetical protein
MAKHNVPKCAVEHGTTERTCQFCPRVLMAEGNWEVTLSGQLVARTGLGLRTSQMQVAFVTMFPLMPSRYVAILGIMHVRK